MDLFDCVSVLQGILKSASRSHFHQVFVRGRYDAKHPDSPQGLTQILESLVMLIGVCEFNVPATTISISFKARRKNVVIKQTVRT